MITDEATVVDEQLITLRTVDEVEELIVYLADKDIVTFDTETTGVDDSAEIIGLSICAENDVGYYVITSEWNTESKSLSYLETIEAMPRLMETLAGKRLVMHNGIFDCRMVSLNYKVELIQSLFCDTMILAHILDENRRVGLKDLCSQLYGAWIKNEQEEMKASVSANGGELTKSNYELYKADSSLIAKYGAKDAILTWNLFYEYLPQLYDDGLDKFFFEDESMPLLRGPTYDMNTTGLRVDMESLADLKRSLEIEIAELKAFVYKEITPHIHERYPATSDKTTFNIGSGEQLAWLLFEKLGNTFPKLSDAGQDLCRALEMRLPYDSPAKRNLIHAITSKKGVVWKGKTKIKDYWAYLSTDKAVLRAFSKKYVWVDKLLEYKRLTKMLGTYVEGIQSGAQYGIIRPSFLQHGTTSGRYSSKQPNFQNLPRDDKRIKACIISRPGKTFVGADYAQLEPRVFASYSQDSRLLKCFENGEDFYSVVGIPIFSRYECSVKKGDPNFFRSKFDAEGHISKVVALSATYGNTAHNLAPAMGVSKDQAQEVLNRYFENFPQVRAMMTEAHNLAKSQGYVESLYGRKRRIPDALNIDRRYGPGDHSGLPYEARKLLNLAVNHRIQSTGASIMNRSAISVWLSCKELAAVDPAWSEVKIVLQVHDELILEGPKHLAADMAAVLKDAMENTCTLPGVSLVAQPVIANNLADLK